MSGFSHESWISAGKKWQPELKRISRYSGICRIGPSQWYMTRPTNWEADFPIFNYTFYPSVWVPGFTKSSDSIMKENERKKKKKSQLAEIQTWVQLTWRSNFYVFFDRSIL